MTLGGCSKKYTKSETVEHKINTAGKKKLKIDNIRGSITIARSTDSNSLSVKAYKEIKVKKKYLDRPFTEIDINLDTVGSVITLETDIDKEGEDGIFKFDISKKQRVDYEIRIPDGIEIEIENVSGNISADNLNNDLYIDLVNGDVSVDGYTGRLQCDVTNGDFSGHVDSTRGVEINIINGGITLFLNNYMNASLRAETVHGKITEENLQFKEIIREKKLFKGKLGSGDIKTDIRLENVNGKIRLFGRNEI